MPDVVHVALSGRTKSGKTNMFYDFADSLTAGTHGYAQWRAMKIDLNREHMIRVRKSREAKRTDSTRVATDTLFDLSFRKDQRSADRYSCSIHVRDSPGGAAYPVGELDAAMAAEKIKYDDWLKQSVGIVLVVSALESFKLNGESGLVDSVELFFDNAGKAEFQNLKRLVFVVSMFDLLLLKFGRMARIVAANPQAVLDILHAHLFPVRRLIENFKPAPGQRNQLDLRFLATSSYGFVPEFGCPNVDVDSAELDPALESYPEPLADRSPYMVADPFVFAATGLENQFLFKREEILSGKLRA